MSFQSDIENEKVSLALDASHNEIASSLKGEQDGLLGHAFSCKCWTWWSVPQLRRWLQMFQLDPCSFKHDPGVASLLIWMPQLINLLCNYTKVSLRVVAMDMMANVNKNRLVWVRSETASRFLFNVLLYIRIDSQSSGCIDFSQSPSKLLSF